MSKRHRAGRASAPAVVVQERRHPAAPFPRTLPRTVEQELRSLRRVRESLAVRERAAVVAARSQGMPWHRVADLLGVPLTSVHRRYREDA